MPHPYGYPPPPGDFTPGGMPPHQGPIPGHPGPPPQPPQEQQRSGSSGGRTLSQSKRAEQNRKAQRAFRERREQHVKTLESRSQLLDAALASADEANRRWEECRTIVDQLRIENATLRAALQAAQAQLMALNPNASLDINLNPDPNAPDGPPPLVKYYLVLYNILSALGWSYILVCTLVHLFNLDKSSYTSPLHAWLARIPYLPAARKLFAKSAASRLEASLPAWAVPVLRRAGTTYARVGRQTAFVQSWAALEVLHVLLGWVRSPLVTTLIQVGSRLYLVWGITYQFPETHSNPLYASMVLSWSITEVVRYTFYACNLLGSEPRLLFFLRYTLFYVLYPTGASSEALLIYATLPHTDGFAEALFRTTNALEGAHALVRQVLFFVWWPGLYVMYTHMMKQRRKVYGGGKTLGAKPKSL
ncbi:hypothetical protein BN946_scf184941.g20 [Trametes cinnabarina]|uniref:Very-long-chain (3R)-3-hydroxyacyl-CoA dehydratase n=1 Tax=Pycnoporus cinnabarinus TaxID=5643 RepID=A0A060SMA7_PYCCI|nr:hypothetical protein BN946_scf184941.g20 [Trametes cinnabarina]